MFTADSRHKGLAIFRAHKAEKKEIAIITKEIVENNPDKSNVECRILAVEIRAARQRDSKRKVIKGKRRNTGVTVTNGTKNA